MTDHRRWALLVLALLIGCTQAQRMDGGASIPAGPTAGSDASPQPGAETTPGAGPASDETRVLGMLPSEDAAEGFEAPESVAAGVPFTVVVTTTGNGCDRAGDTGVIQGEMDATLMAYDFTRANRPGVVCTMIFKQLRHEARLTFHHPGEVTIRIWGRRPRPEAPPLGAPVVFERRIRVRAS